MALLDTASLIVTSNGYKDSKLYSIVPSDGSGDMTFSRTGNTATRVNSSGLIETVNANIPRLDYFGSTCPKLLMEPQRTNLLNYSEQFENAYWTKNNITISANSTTAPDGNTTADTFNSTNTTFNILRRSVTTTIGTTYTSSIFVKKNNYRYIGMRALYAGSDTFNFYDFDTNTITNAGSSSNPLKVENYGNGWYRLSQTSTATLTSHLFDVGYVNSSGNNAALPAGTEKYYVWGAQVEAGAFATSYIPTTTASVTRNADTCSKTAISSLIGQTQGTLFFNVKGFADNYLANNFITFNDGSIDNQIGFNFAVSTGLIRGYFRVNSTTTTITSSVLKTNNAKIILKYSSNNYSFFINGTLIGTGTSATGFSSPLSVLKFSQGNDSDIFNGNLNTIAVWKTALTDSECISLTTL